MAEGFGENVAPTAAIRAILGSYPFSVGLLREILQNSDDARATKQAFVLDRRSHGTKTIYHPHLATTQGPALLAYNDGMIKEEDWKAFQNIHRSSKKTDTSKIGKYGVGFRSCYHVTDNPHILSGSHLAILDAKHDFAEFQSVKLGGVKMDVERDSEKYCDHLAAFDSFLPRNKWGKHFNGTIFRFPLRTSPSDISNKTIAPDEISDLLKDFALEELNVSLLFLRNISSVGIYEIGADGKETCVAMSTIHRASLQSYGQYKTQKVTVETHRPGNESEEQEWRVFHAPFSESEAIEALSRRLGGNPSMTLSQHKLIPTIDLAMPLGAEDSTKIGRLFTFLPLPLRTGFPVHINALFSLTQSRQNLRNGGEIGIVKNSDDHALIEWNRMLFDTYIPQAWAHLLGVLVKEDRVGNIFDAWPRLQAEVNSGDHVYWRDMPQHVMGHALGLCVWPILGTRPCTHEPAGNLIFAIEQTSDHSLAALGRSGLLITRTPEDLTHIIRLHYMTQVTFLSPQVAHSRLLHTQDKLLVLNDSDAQIVLSYLLSTKVCDYIIGLPLVPLVGQSRTSLKKRSGATLLPLFDEVLEDLFSCFDPNAVSLRRLPADVRDVLMKQGCRDLNLTHVRDSQVITYLGASPYTSDICRTSSADEMDWLNKFWGWLGDRTDKSMLYGRLGPFYLIPITKGLQTVVAPVFDPAGNNPLAEVLEVLAVPLIDRRLSTTARAALKELKPCSTFHALLRTLPPSTGASLTEDQAQYLSSYLIKALPLAFPYGFPQNDVIQRSRLRALPIYPVLTFSAGGASSTSRIPINKISVVRGVDLSEIPVLPQVNSLVYLDLRSIDQNILLYLDLNHPKPLSIDEMYNMMFQHLKTQTIETQIAFVKYIDVEYCFISRSVLDRLGKESFVPARDGSLRAPKLLIDPSTELARLYPGASSSLPDLSRPLIKELISHLGNLGLLVTQLSIDIVRERARFISENHCVETKDLACVLLNLINSSQLDCHNIFNSPDFPRSLEWIPTLKGLKSPPWCRHSSSHSGKTYLFDKVMPLVVPGTPISFSLSTVFKWSGEVTFEVLSQQLVRVLDGGDKPYDRVHKIVKEFGNRSPTESQLSSLRQLLQGREWVPTRNGSLASTECALLGEEDIPAIGFHSVAFPTLVHPKVASFLQQMGCHDEPPKEIMLKRLQVLDELASGRALRPSIIRGIIRLLAWLPPLTSDDQTKLFIPDSAGILREFNRVCYNDLGERVYLVDIEDHMLVHPEVHDDLARKLELRRLGLLTPDGQDPYVDLDMGEDLMTTIRNRLREYSSSQLLLEFIANASDAGATEFGVLVDTEEGPTATLLSARCTPFQRAPALVIHNNSVFTEDDFRGILRTGIGGKEGRKDTIGQFGLGALTMFHVTEFAMIVSGDQVLFLNPCKAHLPVPRASLKLPLARVRKLYHDHLSQLSGLFGFHLPEDINEHYSYNGTIFRLPLRSSSHFPDVETIFRRGASIDDITSDFETTAPKCLLFTNISDIKFFYRKDHKPRLWWHVSATHEDSSQTKGIDVNTVSISSLPKLFETQIWRTLSLPVHENLPSLIDTLSEKYRLRIPPIARIAACRSPSGGRNLFSTLPLPISLDLPAHISASFILSSDRRSMRLDEYENVEASYNRWLLTTIVPQLYLRLLEDRAAVSDNGDYWPGNSSIGVSEQRNTLSTMVTDAVYQIAAVSDAPILRSQFYDHALSLPTAHLSYLLPRSVVKVLKIIKPHDLVKLPSSITRQLVNAKDSCASTVTPQYVQTQLLGNGSSFDPSTLEFKELQELIDHQTREGCHALLGLRLLPLEDGTITHFESSSRSCFYVVPRAVLEASIFSLNRLVHRQLNTAKLLTSDQPLNVTNITAENIGELLKDHLSAAPILKGASLATQQWIEQFWKVFPLLHLPPSAVATYPLIPTLQTGIYVSISHCTAPSAILADFTYHKWLSQCFTQMGFTSIDAAQLQHEILPHVKPSLLNVESILSILFDRSSRSIGDLFAALDKKSHLSLASWITSCFSLQPKSYFDSRQRYKSLPLWKTAGNTYVSANQVQMLPPYISLEVAAPFAFWNTSNYSMTLVHMGVGPVSSIQSFLHIPRTLQPDMYRKYEHLIRALLSMNSPSLPIPNSRRAIVESDSLYSSQDGLFHAVFGSNSNRFILPSFRHFESRLGQFGLRRQQDLNMDMFEECLVAFQHAADVTDHTTRASVIFQIYSEDLPLRVPANQESQWRDLDRLRFIPRNKRPEPLGQDIETSRYIVSRVSCLPDVVSPNELVRAEFSAIAWTQQALYNVEPHQRVLMAYPGLSIPTTASVVKHLVVLVTEVARDHPRNALVLSQIKQTYTWLNTRAEEAKPLLLQCTEDRVPLFLNVDDPTAEDWQWMPGDHILLETYDAGFYRCPREFLRPFHNLLVAAGAMNINHPEERVSGGNSAEDLLVTIRTSFNQMRKEGICTDVSFTFEGDIPLKAHRSFLAAISTHFKTSFSGSFSEAGDASSSNPIRICMSGFSRRCVELVLELVYTEIEPRLERNDIDTVLALEMLNLTHSWLMDNFHLVIQSVMIKLKMVDPFNLDEVRKVAERTHASTLLEHCDAYEASNRRFVLHARERLA